MKAVVLSLLVLSFAVGEQTFHLLKDRWQMKGGSTSFSPLEQFQNAKIIWKYDNYEKKWLALSVADTDADTINQKISENGYEYITSIDAGEGFWIYNNSVQTVHVEEPSTQYTKLSLQSGWNFISSTVLQDIDLNTLLLPSCVDILWHYNDDNRYAFSNKTAIKDAIESNAIDLYTTITPTDGFWAFSNANTCILDYEKTNQLFIESSKNVLCPGDSVNLSANTNLYESYSWSTQEGTFLAPESQLTEFTLPVDISSGVYNIRLDATLASQQYSAEKNIEVVDAQQSQWHKTAGPNGGDTIKLAQAGEKLLLSTTGGKIFS